MLALLDGELVKVDCGEQLACLFHPEKQKLDSEKTSRGSESLCLK